MHLSSRALQILRGRRVYGGREQKDRRRPSTVSPSRRCPLSNDNVDLGVIRWRSAVDILHFHRGESRFGLHQWNRTNKREIPRRSRLSIWWEHHALLLYRQGLGQNSKVGGNNSREYYFVILCRPLTGREARLPPPPPNKMKHF